MIIDFILLLIEGVLTFLEHFFHSGGFKSRRKVRKSLERRRSLRSERRDSSSPRHTTGQER